MDDWGRDPAVQQMRGVFRSMERAQETFFNALRIPLLDPRLRGWRERALIAFHHAWSRDRVGSAFAPEPVASLYVQSLILVLRSDGVSVPEDTEMTQACLSAASEPAP